MIRLKALLEQATQQLGKTDKPIPNVTMKNGYTLLRGAERLQWDIPAGFWHVEYSLDIPMVLRKNGEDDRTKLTNPGKLTSETGTVSFIVRKIVSADGGITNIELKKVSNRKYALKITVDSGNSRKPGKSDAKVELTGFVPGYSYVIYDEDDNSHLIRFIVKAAESPAGEASNAVGPGEETSQIGITTKSDAYKVGEKLFQQYGDESKTLPVDSEKKRSGGKLILQYYDRVIDRNTEDEQSAQVETRNINKIHNSMIDKVKKYIETNIHNIQVTDSETMANLENWTENDNEKLPLYDKNQELQDPVYYIIKKSNYATYQYKQTNNGHWSDIVTVGHTIITLTPNQIKPVETED
jgi:hypothetical protein